MMDAPLLALTRRPARADAAGLPPETTTADNMRQLVQLRWIAVGGQLIAVLTAHFQLGIPLPIGEMTGTIAALALANYAIAALLPRRTVTETALFAALLLDVAALTLLLFLSGGSTNPFVALYLLQVVLGAILLPPLLVWLLVGATTFAYALLSFVHEPLVLPGSLRYELLLLGYWLSFAMVAFLLVLFIARISGNLRRRIAYATDLAQRAAEEDGIVRMGLFASSAAHELGTPLATLSVILSDWQRHPALRRSAALQRDLADMRGEVQRCTAIVANILQSAGETRGVPMARQQAGDLVAAVAQEWSAANPHAHLSIAPGGDGDGSIAAEPALRQALWNILDNAAEVSVADIMIGASNKADQLLLWVRDSGPGFAPDQLAEVGTAYRSTKGPGHGIGLFLAATVARRLGGRLVAGNRADGGAQVGLLLPRARTGTPANG